MRRRRLGAVAGAAVCAVLLTGCASSNGTAPARPTETAATVSSPSSSSSPATSLQAATATPSVSPTPSARVDPNAPAGQCADAALQVTVQADGELSGAGQAGSFVVFRNTGPTGCVLRGAPGVSLVGDGDGDGTRIGAAAARSTGGSTVTIAPGSYAAAELTYPNIDQDGGAYGDGHGHDPQCEAKPVDGYRVYPPHSFRAFFARAAHLYGCSTDLQALHVGAVRPASSYPSFTPAG